MKELLSTVLAAILVIGCTPKNEIVRKYIWKHAYGYSIGDVLVVDNKTYSMDKELNIHKQGINVAHVISANNTKLVIESPNGEKGYYAVLTDR